MGLGVQFWRSLEYGVVSPFTACVVVGGDGVRLRLGENFPLRGGKLPVLNFTIINLTIVRAFVILNAQRRTGALPGKARRPYPNGIPNARVKR